MVAISLVTEGITDQVVISAIVKAFYKDQIEIDIHRMQPAMDDTDENRQSDSSYGGYERVFEFISDEDQIDRALTNDFLIIQIDADVCRDDSIDVKMNSNTIADELEEIVSKKIPHFDLLKEKIIFAIPVYSTECWLIPLHTKDVSIIANYKKCEDNIFTLKNGNISKNYDDYNLLVRGFKKNKDVLRVAQINKSLQRFLTDLNKISRQINLTNQ